MLYKYSTIIIYIIISSSSGSSNISAISNNDYLSN